jgi:hypothetical protein
MYSDCDVGINVFVSFDGISAEESTEVKEEKFSKTLTVAAPMQNATE